MYFFNLFIDRLEQIWENHSRNGFKDNYVLVARMTVLARKSTKIYNKCAQPLFDDVSSLASPSWFSSGPCWYADDSSEMYKLEIDSAPAGYCSVHHK